MRFQEEVLPVKKVPLRLACAVVGVVALSWMMGSSAIAMKPFHDEFMAKYAKPESSDKRERAFAEAAQAAKCSICHQGKTKAVRNAYGRALGQFLSENDIENKQKIRAGLEKVAQVKSDPNDPHSPTFGNLIKAGKLPGGTARTNVNSAVGRSGLLL